MAMDPAWVIDRLESNVSVFQGQLRLVRSPQAMWKPAPDEWSIVEVINHLVEEETDDFRMRLRFLLEDPAKEWPDIDPQRSVEERHFNSRAFRSRFIDLPASAPGLWSGCELFLRRSTGRPRILIPGRGHSGPEISSVPGWRTI